MSFVDSRIEFSSLALQQIIIRLISSLRIRIGIRVLAALCKFQRPGLTYPASEYRSVSSCFIRVFRV